MIENYNKFVLEKIHTHSLLIFFFKTKQHQHSSSVRLKVVILLTITQGIKCSLIKMLTNVI